MHLHNWKLRNFQNIINILHSVPYSKIAGADLQGWLNKAIELSVVVYASSISLINSPIVLAVFYRINSKLWSPNILQMEHAFFSYYLKILDILKFLVMDLIWFTHMYVMSILPRNFIYIKKIKIKKRYVSHFDQIH